MCLLSPLCDAAGISTALRMCYKGYGYPLTLFLEEGGVVTVCKINTQEPEEPIDFEFCSANVTNKVYFSVFWLLKLEYQKKCTNMNTSVQKFCVDKITTSLLDTIQLQ